MTLLRRMHRDEAGSMSIVSMFSLVLLVFLLGLVMNTGRVIDQRVKMQNAADSVAWSSGVMMARGMNTLAYTNHLTADVFALTAFMREARDRNAETYVTSILDNWQRIGPFMATSEYPSFAALGLAITEKVPWEREMVQAYSAWGSAAAESMLPVLEEILREHRIPDFQQALTVATPALATFVAEDAANRHGQKSQMVHGVIWRTSEVPETVDGQSSYFPVLPVVNPNLVALVGAESGGGYIQESRAQRQQLARRYLTDWNNESLRAFDRYGKMSQFGNLWRIFTCGYLRQLLEQEYPSSNLLFVLRHADDPPSTQHEYLERDFMYVGVMYAVKAPEFIPGVFRNTAFFDRQAHAQVMMFVPRRRLIRVRVNGPGGSGPPGPPVGESIGGIPGENIDIPPDPAPLPPPGPAPTVGPPNPPPEPEWLVVRQSGSWHSDDWNLLNQNWHLQLVPATASATRTILSRPVEVVWPDGVSVGATDGFSLPNQANWLPLTEVDFHNLNHH
jgi:hypothetical protein